MFGQHPRSPYFVSLLVALLIMAATKSSQAEGEGRLYLLSRGERVAAYQASRLPSPKPEAPWYGRSGFLHPVYTPAGRVVTNDFPDGHTHQHGLMFAWTSARVDGRPVDFWNSHQRQGRIEHLETVRAADDSIVVVLQHLDLTAGTPTPVLLETWEVDVVEHPAMHVFDLTSTQICILGRPLVIDEYHYGAMGVRGAEDFEQNCVMRTSAGHDRIAGNHTKARWAALAGEVDGAACGIGVLGHPQNFRSPQPVRLHPEAPYFCFAPMVEGRFEIAPSQPYVSRFRFAAFDGPIDPEALDQLWADYEKANE